MHQTEMQFGWISSLWKKKDKQNVSFLHTYICKYTRNDWRSILLNEKKEAKINHRPCMQNNINNK